MLSRRERSIKDVYDTISGLLELPTASDLACDGDGLCMGCVFSGLSEAMKDNIAYVVLAWLKANGIGRVQVSAVRDLVLADNDAVPSVESVSVTVVRPDGRPATKEDEDLPEFIKYILNQ